MKNRKGFTLIELLAVVIVLGILMLIAVPAVTSYIDDSRKNGYVSTAKSITGGVRTLANSTAMDFTDPDITYYVEGKCVKTETDLQSPYADFDKAYVIVTTTEDGHDYYWTSVDKKGVGVKNITPIDKLSVKDIETGINADDIQPNKTIEGRSKVAVVGGENCTMGEPYEVTDNLDPLTGEISAICPRVTDTIYWALQDTNTDGYADKLVLSNSEVTGLESGNFSGSQTFDYETPWSSSYDYGNITSIDVTGPIVPTSTAYWFNNAGSSASSFSANVGNINTCRVTNMSSMFSYAGAYATSWSIQGLNNFDTSNVTNMNYLFYYAGQYAPTINLNLSGWKTSKAPSVNMAFSGVGMHSNSFTLNLEGWSFGSEANYLFGYAGRESSTYNLNLKNTNTSRVTSMSNLFYESGRDATNWNVQGISNWDTSNVTNMSYMFYNAGKSATSFTLDLSKWNVSKVTNVSRFLGYTGYNAQTYNVNMSGWNLASLTGTYGMFGDAGLNARNVTLNLSGWSLPQMQSLSDFFNGFGSNSQTLNMNLTNWNTSNITNFYGVFYNTGANANTVNININGWNFSKATYFYDMFNGTGSSASSLSITIPKTNSNGLNNTSSMMYGQDSTYYAEPPTGRTFTVAS